MPTPSPDSRAQRSATRAPVGQQIKLQFDDSMDVVEGACENISIGGMFIQVPATRPRGSLVRFELQIDNNIAIRGLGEVVWNRAKNAALSSEAGIGLKFRFLEQRDRQLIFKLVSQHIKERLAKQQAPAAAAPSPQLPTPPPRPPESRPPESRPPESTGSLTATSPRIASPDGPRAVDVVVDDRPRWPEPEPDDEEPTMVGRRSARMAAPSPPAASPSAATPPSPGLPTPLPGQRTDLYQSSSGGLDDELDQMRTPPPSPRPPSADRDLDRGGKSPSTAGAYDFDDLLGGAGVSSSGPVREDSVVARYDLPTASKRRPLLPIAVVVLLLLAAAGYWFRDALFGGDAAAAAFDPPPPPAPAAAEPTGASPLEATAAEAAVAQPSTSEPAPPPPRPAAPPRAAQSPSPSAPPAARRLYSRVVDIRWDSQGGVFRVVVEADGTIPEDRYHHFRLDGDPPREVVQLRGVQQGYGQSQIAVGSPALRQIRIGYHEKKGGNELHVVLDMADPRARITAIRPIGSGLEILIAGP